MRVGDIVNTTYIQQILGTMKLYYKAGKGKQYVFVFLGTENKDGSDPVDLEKTMGRLGWGKKEQK